jgi:hypothetical protein
VERAALRPTDRNDTLDAGVRVERSTARILGNRIGSRSPSGWGEALVGTAVDLGAVSSAGEAANDHGLVV